MVTTIMKIRKGFPLRKINPTARRLRKIRERKENAPNVVSGEAIPRRSVRLTNRRRKRRKQTSRQLEALKLQVEQSRKFPESHIMMTAIMRKTASTSMRRTGLRPWMYLAKTMPTTQIIPEGPNSRNSERDLLRT